MKNKLWELGEEIKECNLIEITYQKQIPSKEVVKRVQFMFPGRLLKLRFRYTGRSVEAILDRLPTARVISEEKDGVVVEAEVYGKGILMWLLSQGNMVEVLSPKSLREEMKNLLHEMLDKYEK